MSVEIPEPAENYENVAKAMNGNQDQRLNGMSNGHIEDDKHKSSKNKSSSKDKHRDKERDRDKDYKSSSKSTSSSNRDKESDKVKSSSSGKDKHRDKDRDKDKHKSSSHKSSSRDKDKGRDKDKERERDKDKDRDREKDKDRDREKDKDRDKPRDKDRHRDKDKDKNKERSSDKDRDKKKDVKSSSSGAHDKDKERSKDKDRHKSSSSSKDKHSSSSTSKSKDKDKEREKDRHSSSKDRDRDRHREKDKKDKLCSEDFQKELEVKPEKKQESDFSTSENEQKCDNSEITNEYNNTSIKKDIATEPYKFSYGDNQVDVKQEYSINISQASSCDYSMSQFRDDEPSFQVRDDMALNEDSQTIKTENDVDYDDEEDIPLAKRKVQILEESDDDVPLVNRKKIKTIKKEKKAKKKKYEEADDDYNDDDVPKKKIKKEKSKSQTQTQGEMISPKKGRKPKEEEPQEVWRWWEEEKRQDGVKWSYLEHKGPIFAPPYERLPDNIKFYYDKKEMKLSQDAEEVACFYAKMLSHDYVTKKSFNDNFFKDWRKSMTSKEKDSIKDLSKCDFHEIHNYFLSVSEKNKNRSKEEKLALKEANEKLIQEYGFCVIDGHKERIGNFKIEPPGLFRGRGEHPKMGMVKRRVIPEDVSINCSKDSKIPQPPPGHKWKDVRHDNTVTWLACWSENVQGQVKYIMLNPSSKLKGEKDFQKYEVARRLDKQIEQIRKTYREEWKSKEMRIRQRGVALYFIDKLALRAGNEKDEDQADTVGCCSLRVEHVALHKELNGRENVVIFDFLGKDSIRYYNEVEVEKRVFKNLELFMENKKEGDDLFDRLNTAVLNEHLRDLMEGLTAKVFRTYNASITLQNQLDLLTDENYSLPEKILAYNRANRAVAVLCNHQRSVPKSHAKSMENLKEKIRVKRELIDDFESEMGDYQRAAKRGSQRDKIVFDKRKKQLDRLKDQLKKLELQETDRDENKTIALGTSKLNYLDPRISVAWCKKHDVPIDKIYNKTQRDKFRWAIHMATEDYRF